MERGLLNIINYGDHDQFHHVVVCLTEADVFAQGVRSPSCEVVELHKRNGNDWSLPRRISALARQHGVDVFHARGWPTLVETACARWISPVRATIYGFHGRTLQDLQGLSAKRRWVQKLAVRSYTRILTLTHRMQAELATECALPKDRIHVIANGVDEDVFRPRDDQAALREIFGLPPDRFIVGTVGRLDPVKNHEVLIRAMRSVNDQGTNAFLVVIGDGVHRPTLEREIERMNVGRDVRLFGRSDRIAELLNCVDVYVQPSFYEGFSNTILEAMACGIPVVATDVGGTADLFTGGQEGEFFNPTDHAVLAEKILALQRNRQRYDAMSARARRRVVDHFSMNRMVRHYEATYRDLVRVGKR